LLEGTYKPQPVKRVEIPKPDGGIRKLGGPCVVDRLIQQAMLQVLQERWDPTFSEHSYGFRPGRSADQAVAQAQLYIAEGCNVVVDLEKSFDRVNHDGLMAQVAERVADKRVLKLIRAFLNAGVMEDGLVRPVDEGTPPGGPVSPILANLFLHYAFDRWMKDNHPDIPFERYADDAICHCRSEAQALSLRQALEARLAACKLQLHPQKTKIVYCRDSNRTGSYPEQRFDFLGFTFRPRQSMNRAGKLFVSFSPAVSDKAGKAMREVVRRWKLHHRNDLALEKIARWTQPILVGWVNYYGRFHRSALRTIDTFIVRWAQRKYQRLRGHTKRAWDWLRGIKSRQPDLFAHWLTETPVGR